MYSMLSMTSSIAAKRPILTGPSRGARGRDTAAIRRYRIARVRLEGQQRVGEPRHAHLKRIYD